MKWVAVITAVIGLGVGIGAGFALASARGEHGHAETGEAHDAKSSDEKAEEKKDGKKEDKKEDKPEEKAVAAICRVRTAKVSHGDLPLPLTAFGFARIG